MKRFFLILSLVLNLNLNFSLVLNASEELSYSKIFLKKGKSTREFYNKYKLQLKVGFLTCGSSLTLLYLLQKDPEQFIKAVIIFTPSFVSLIALSSMLIISAKADIQELE
jgi:hypothetical protein